MCHAQAACARRQTLIGDSRSGARAALAELAKEELAMCQPSNWWWLFGFAIFCAITTIGASYAADKITLICSNGEGADDYSLSIDLDRKLASFHMSDLPDADGIPVTRVTENYIWFQNKALSGTYSQGKLDRITGSLHFFYRRLNNAKDYYLRCKPAKPFDGPAP